MLQAQLLAARRALAEDPALCCVLGVSAAVAASFGLAARPGVARSIVVYRSSGAQYEVQDADTQFFSLG